MEETFEAKIVLIICGTQALIFVNTTVTFKLVLKMKRQYVAALISSTKILESWSCG